MHDLSTNKLIRGFQALPQSRASLAGLEPATEGSLQISRRVHYQLHASTLPGNLIGPYQLKSLHFVNIIGRPKQTPQGSQMVRITIDSREYGGLNSDQIRLYARLSFLNQPRRYIEEEDEFELASKCEIESSRSVDDSQILKGEGMKRKKYDWNLQKLTA
ncbi:hypothetical protein PoB_001169700 [Plakobranchus ocellatus]|uniref:Uncharacterized protein n=1 Tax=Plakobranchus ocellatus TaxID=259542 RepID=A0AAV3YSR5_9GAST|nr:hypothetical protein PoB_001169700 [Plakobranchus ocellatus]